MELSIRPLEQGDYDLILTGWWKDWGWEPPQRDFLPNDATSGIMVMDGEMPVCAGFLYTTNSRVAWVDWIISNKEYKKKPQRSEAIKLLIDTLTNVARNTDRKFVYALIKHEGLIQTYESLGYIKGDTYTSEMIKAL